MAGFLGMRGTGNWATDQRPMNWREGILYLYPNGTAPLTAILSKLGSEKVDDPQFHWWTKTLPTQRATVTGRFTDVALATPYVSGGVAGDVLYIQMSAADCGHFREGHKALLRDASDYEVDKNGKVVVKVLNGASSYVGVRLLEDDATTTNNHDLSDADTLLIIGNINPEGGFTPDAVSYDPVKWYNYTGIWKTSLDITRTARLTKLRTGDAYKEMKRECLELHSIEMEKDLLWSIPTENIGANGKPERTTLGLVPAIRGGYTGQGGVGGTVDDYTLNTSYAGLTWLQGGEEWLDTELEVMFRYGRKERLVFAGSGALLGVQRLVKSGAHMNITPTIKSYGLAVNEWTTPFGVINLLVHPLFSYEATNRYSMVLFEPENLKFKYITDTTFYKANEKEVSSIGTRKDGTTEEFLTEAGLEYHHPIAWGYLNGVGQDNALC